MAATWAAVRWSKRRWKSPSPADRRPAVVFNGTADFVVASGAVSAPAIFIFASESGAVTGWHPAVPPPPPSTSAQPAFQATDGAVYTGIALANNGSGNFLYLADFRNGEIDVLECELPADNAWPARSPTRTCPPASPRSTSRPSAASSSWPMPSRTPRPTDESPASTRLHQRLRPERQLRAAAGLAGQAQRAVGAWSSAPAGFGDFGGDLLVGNSGDGRINAYDPATGAFQGTLRQSPGRPIEIDGLRGLAFGNGVSAGDATTLYYAAGPDDETHGLFGKITANAAGTNPVQATLTDGNLVITGSRNDDHIRGEAAARSRRRSSSAPAASRSATSPLAAVGTIQFSGLAGNDRISSSISRSR